MPSASPFVPRVAAVLVALASLSPSIAPAAVGAPPLSRAAHDILTDLAFAGGDPDNPCPGAVLTRTINVTSLAVPVSYNHWGDFDPFGRLFVVSEERSQLLADVEARLREAGLLTLANAVEGQKAALDSAAGDPVAAAQTLQREATFIAENVSLAASPRENHDALLDPATGGAVARFDTSPLVRPFVVRAHLGECVRFRLFNALPEPVGLHVHAAATRPGQGMALGSNAPDLALPGETREYVVYLPPLPGMEGAHLLHSHADPRYQTKHGLFGALVAELPGSAWLAPDGSFAPSGPEAMIVRDGASDFREYVIFYHDEVELFDHLLRPLPVVSDTGGEYGPGSKAINLRSEPFMNRFRYVDQLHETGVLSRPHDKSQGYGSYTHGDPGTFIPRAYVGDPTKFRLVNVGPGQHHVHHLHGGGIRWRVSPVTEDTQFDDGLVKANPQVRSRSERVDVQNLGPGESFNAEIEGGAGGVQQSVGDFLFHCHIVEHYLAGMWTIWRVFDTLQPGLAELPDRARLTPHAVNSLGLLGRRLPDGTVLDRTNVRGWVESQLPPRGVTLDDEDASVWDWSVTETGRGPLYKGEPETTLEWPNYKSPAPDERPVLKFNPANGRLSFPFLTPHLGKRPPFAPGHGPAPYLGAEADANHPDGLCPPGAPHRDYNVVAIATTVRYNARDKDVNGQIFVRAEDKAAVVSGAKPATSLVLRANQGDCVDVLLTSRLPEPVGERSKVNMHTHLVQFDVQGTDGVVTGLNYEQSVRPATSTGTFLKAVALPGATTLSVANAAAIRVGTPIGVGLTEPHAEIRKVVAVANGTITLDRPLERGHALGERVGSEFVRYRWFPDVELGVVYWHDHVDGLNSWRHGLFGALVVEPAGSQWCDPKRPAANRTTCGDAWTRPTDHVVDVVSAGDPANRSLTYREMVLQPRRNVPRPTRPPHGAGKLQPQERTARLPQRGGPACKLGALARGARARARRSRDRPAPRLSRRSGCRATCLRGPEHDARS